MTNILMIGVCILAVYFFVLGMVDTLIRCTSWLIRKLGGDDSSMRKHSMSQNIVSFLRTVSQGRNNADELKEIADELLAEIEGMYPSLK